MTDFMKLCFKWGVMTLLLLLVAASSVSFGIWLGTRDRLAPRIRSLTPTVTQLERIGELAATRVHVADVLSAEGEGYRGSWLVKGDAILSCDVSQARIDHVNTKARTATIFCRVCGWFLRASTMTRRKSGVWRRPPGSLGSGGTRASSATRPCFMPSN